MNPFLQFQTPASTITNPLSGKSPGTRVMKKLKNGHAHGADGIPAKLLSGPVSKAVHAIFCSVWWTGQVHSDWKDSIISLLIRGKRSKNICSNYRPITRFSVPDKIFAHVILACIQPLLQRVHRPQQSGSFKNRSTTDETVALQLLSKLHRECDRPLNVAFLDIKSAFNSVDQTAFWKATHSKGIPLILVDLITALYESTGTQVRVGQQTLQQVSNDICGQTRVHPHTHPLLGGAGSRRTAVLGHITQLTDNAPSSSGPERSDRCISWSSP